MDNKSDSTSDSVATSAHAKAAWTQPQWLTCKTCGSNAREDAMAYRVCEGHLIEDNFMGRHCRMEPTPIKIFKMNDCDWWLAQTKDQAIADYEKETGEREEWAEVEELTDRQLDALMFTDTDENEVPIGGKRPFREQLAIEVAQGGAFPRMFASTES